MEQPEETARDNGPASSADGADAGPVVCGRREWRPGDTVGPQDFGIAPAAPNPLADAMRKDASRTAERMLRLAEDNEEGTQTDG